MPAFGAGGVKNKNMSMSIDIETIRDGKRTGHRRFTARSHGVVRIGRMIRANVILGEPHASSLHAAIDLRDNRAVIRDMGTMLGTLVNGERIDSQEIRDGDVIGIGKTQIFVHLTKSKASPPPVLENVLPLGRAPFSGFIDTTRFPMPVQVRPVGKTKVFVDRPIAAVLPKPIPLPVAPAPTMMPRVDTACLIENVRGHNRRRKLRFLAAAALAVAACVGFVVLSRVIQPPHPTYSEQAMSSRSPSSAGRVVQ